MSKEELHYVFKVTVIGNGRVGKTTLIKRFTRSSFEKDYIKTIGAQLSKHDKIIEGSNVKLMLWDIAGQDDFSFFRPSFYKNSKAAIIVYSLEDNYLGKESFNHISKWHDELNQYCGDIPIILFANKVDLIDENSIDKTMLEKLVKDHNFLEYKITSAKSGQGVYQAFNSIMHELYQKYKELTPIL